MRAVERLIQTRNTREFIDAEVLEVRFTRTLTTPNFRGGVQQSGQFLTKLQRVRFIQMVPRRRRSGLSTTTAGRAEVDHDRIITLPDADVKVGDEFDHVGFRWRITRITPKPYEKIAEVDIQES